MNHPEQSQKKPSCSKTLSKETSALLMIIALGEKQVEEGKTTPAEDAIRMICKRYKSP